MEPLKIAKGINGQIEVFESKIIIKRKGIMAFATQGLKGNKEILINQISSIQFKKEEILLMVIFNLLSWEDKKAKEDYLMQQ